MAKLTRKAQEQLDDAVDSLGGGTIRPTRRATATKKKTRAGTRKTSRVKKPSRKS